MSELPFGDFHSSEPYLSPAASQSVLDIAEEMGLNPALDLDLLWVVQEYLNAQLPGTYHS